MTKFKIKIRFKIKFTIRYKIQIIKIYICIKFRKYIYIYV